MDVFWYTDEGFRWIEPLKEAGGLLKNDRCFSSTVGERRRSYVRSNVGVLSLSSVAYTFGLDGLSVRLIDGSRTAKQNTHDRNSIVRRSGSMYLELFWKPCWRGTFENVANKDLGGWLIFDPERLVTSIYERLRKTGFDFYLLHLWQRIWMHVLTFFVIDMIEEYR